MKKLFFSFLTVLSILGAKDASAATFTTQTVKDSISTNTTWTNDKQYLLKGYVYVTSGATLTIDAGTIIRGDKDTKGTLIIERGAKIIANGTAQDPIIFTSNQPQGSRNYGDWGGVILCGKAPNNWKLGTINGSPLGDGVQQVEGGPRSLYGGTDAHDNSGELHYVRIEFGGVALTPNNEINGLTLCSVGDATKIDHIQVSYSGDDSYEFFGGTVNTKYMVSLGCWDDDFDTDNGYQGKNQFVFSVRANNADLSGSKAFEDDSYQSGTNDGKSDTDHLTKPVFSNATVIGAVGSNPCNTNWNSNFTAAMHIRRGGSQSTFNSVIVSWPAALLIDESSSAFASTTGNIANGNLQFNTNVIAGTYTSNCSSPNPISIVYVKDGARSLTPVNTNADTTTGSPFGSYPGPFTWLKSTNTKIYPTEGNGTKLHNPFAVLNGTPLQEDPTPTSVSPICYNSSSVPSAWGYANNVRPFDPTKPINTDTTGLYNHTSNYNAPDIVPNFSTGKVTDPFFDKVNYVGAFAGTQLTSDNWMRGWCNFDPNNTNYEYANTSVAKQEALAGGFASAVVYPNPATSEATLVVDLNRNTNIRVTVMDITGKVVAEIFNGMQTVGKQHFAINTSALNTGLYLVNVAAEDKQQTVKLKVIK